MITLPEVVVLIDRVSPLHARLVKGFPHIHNCESSLYMLLFVSLLIKAMATVGYGENV